MNKEHFFKDPRIPFLEARYTKSSQSVFKAHMHTTFSIGAIDEGCVEYLVDSEQARLEPGSLAIINPEILHSCNAISEGGRSYFMLYLDRSWCTAVQNGLWGVKQLQPANVIKLNDQELYDEYCSGMHTLIHNQVHLQEKEQIAFDLASKVFLQCCQPHTELRSTPENIKKLKELLKGDLEKDLTLDSLSDRLGVNPYTLIRKFKSETGLTPHAYRMNHRIEKAKLYLQNGDDIAETAIKCGFFDQSHLHRNFKAMTTITPREYQVNFVQ